MKSWAFVTIFTLAVGTSLTALAGGPLLVGSPKFGVDGQPFVWDNSRPIQYRTDTGNLGSIDNTTANSHVQQAFDTWTKVPTASISSQRVGSILGVANGHVASVADFNTVVGSCNSATQTPVIYDANGSLLAQLVGDASVVGFESMCSLTPTGHIQSALVVLSGGSGLTIAQQDQVMTHELGHLFGLDHSLPGQDPCGTSKDDLAALPIMYFQLSGQTALTQDDKAWISKLYPSASFNSVYGTITGQVLFSDGQNGVQDVLVTAHPISPGTLAGENRAIAVSSISGFRFTGNPGQPYTADYLACTPASQCPHGFYGNDVDGSQFGSRTPALIGWYEIPVPAGSYAVEISAINDGGSIGPNNPNLSLPGPGEYWNPHESSTDGDFSSFNCTLPIVLNAVTVQAGTPSSGIDFIMNGTASTFDLFESARTAPIRLSRSSLLLAASQFEPSSGRIGR